MYIIYLHACMCMYAHEQCAAGYVSNNSCPYLYLLGVVLVLFTLYLYILSKVLLRYYPTFISKNVDNTRVVFPFCGGSIWKLSLSRKTEFGKNRVYHPKLKFLPSPYILIYRWYILKLYIWNLYNVINQCYSPKFNFKEI